MLQKNTDYVLCENAVLMSSKAPTSQTKGICLGTKDYIFFIGTQTLGFYPMLQTIRNHRVFEGVSVEDGIATLIGMASSVEALETSFSELLENNPKYVHRISSYDKFFISGIFIKNNLRLVKSRFDFNACILKPKAVAKEFREFYGQ